MNLLTGAIFTFALCTGISCFAQSHAGNQPVSGRVLGRILNACPSALNDSFCLNGGTSRAEKIYRQTTCYCECPPEFFGERCEIKRKTDGSIACPTEVGDRFCVNGGTCVEGNIGDQLIYYCECPDDYFKERCQTKLDDTDPCPPDKEETFCMNGGTCYAQCYEDQEYYFCECPRDYTGLRCQHETLPEQACVPPFYFLLCLNGGTCSRLMWHFDLIYSCHCAEGYYGVRCEREYKRAGHFQCKNESFCLNGGTCYAMGSEYDPVYFCECKDGYTGQKCELKLEAYGEPCSPLIQEIFCRNGGTCYEGNVGGFTMYYCQCRVSFWGPRCEEQSIMRLECPEALQTNLCSNGGQCVAITSNGQDMIYFCQCAEGFNGITCEYSDKPISTVSECPRFVAERYCLNNGTCYKDIVSDIPSYYCVCPHPYHGERCELRFTTVVPCQDFAQKHLGLCPEHSTCIEITLKDVVVNYCECSNLFYGLRCEHSSIIPPATEEMVCHPSMNSVLCLHGGTCIQIITNQLHKLYFCKCVEGFYGFSCEYPYPPVHKTLCPKVIADSHCLNGGTCFMMVVSGMPAYYCLCPSQFHGDKCEKHAAKFELQESSGTQCPHNIAKSFCMNGGTCYMEFSTGGEPIYYCACVRPYYGERCKEKVHRRSLSLRAQVNSTCPPLIAAVKCQNGGSCVINVTNGDTIPYCICPAPFYGEECEFSTLVSNYRSRRSLNTPCPTERREYCLNGGTCYMTEIMNEKIYNCKCPFTYFGTRCEFRLRQRISRLPCPEDMDINFCLNGGTCYMENDIDTPVFRCICSPLYIGNRCEQTVYYRSHSDQCSADNVNKLCQNGGTCLRYTFTGDTIYHCQCPLPFYGQTCELIYPDPLSCPPALKTVLCLNGGLCVVAESNGHYVHWCQCLENHYGARCEHVQQKIMPCPVPFNIQMCKNGGTCVNVINNEGQQIIACKCTEAFTGPSCEYSIPYVPKLPDVCPPTMKATFCLNGGKCQASRAMGTLTYYCKCSHPYHGDRCELQFSAVTSCSQRFSSCLCCNDGHCAKITLDDCDVYYCVCPDGYYGARCEHVFDTQQPCPRPFNTDLCKNAGTCVAIMTREKQTVYFCKCLKGFYGMSCEYPYPALQLSCLSCPPYITRNRCLNGGKCCMDFIAADPIYYCVCPEPYYGERCDMKHSQELSCSLPFKRFFCLNGGLCIQGKSNGYNVQWCECKKGYYGARCEHVHNSTANQRLKCIPDLQRNLCKNGGTCVGIVAPSGCDLFFCECPERFYGLFCENLHMPVPSAVSCPHDEMAPYCLHGGACFFDAFQSLYYCICPYPFAGERCEYTLPEQSSCPQSINKYLCLNGGTCIYVRLVHYGFYYCICLEGFYGSMCEYEEAGVHQLKCPHPLDNELCKNGGTCYGIIQTVNHTNLYFCKCLDNFYGISCEYQYVHDANQGNDCPPEIEQHFCENGGTCFSVNIEGIAVYYCECLKPYYGGRCEFIDSKPQSCPWVLHQFLCLNGGVCTSFSGNNNQCDTYYCECKDGYGGHRCENKIFPEVETEYCTQPACFWFCFNKGICFQEVINGQNIYHCDCKKNFLGDRCQFEVTGKPKPCPHGFNDVFCLHNGRCLQTSVGQVTMFYCECQNGFVGERCEFKEPRIKDCCPESIGKILCLNGGTCYKEIIREREYYICACQGHYFGPRCEYQPATTEICPPDLTEQFCLYGGTCYSFMFEPMTAYYCQCADGHYGGRCEHAVNNTLVEGLCSPDIADWFCMNGGTCFHILVLNEPFYYCECQKQYTGARCEFKLSAQTVMCSVNVTEVFCRLGSECFEVVLGGTTFHHCVCSEAYRGSRCQYEKYKHTCPAILGTEFCLNGGSCRVLFFKGHIVYYCECTTEYYGLRCETKFPYAAGVAYPCEESLAANYCQNGGTCYETENEDGKVNFCECPEGYTGLRCEYLPVESGPYPPCPSPIRDSYCMNGGSCLIVSGTDGPYKCECLKGYSGLRCESKDIGPTGKESNCFAPHNESFCLNGGTCYQNEPGPNADQRCHCPSNYYGPRCESSATLLAFHCPQNIVSDFCYNGGTCYQIDHGPDTIYFCHCPEDYRGLRCEYGPESSVNQTQLCPPPLNEQYCQNGGTCYQMDNGTNTLYFCECEGSFTGPRCEHWPHPIHKCDFPLDETFCYNNGTCHQVIVAQSAVYYCECQPNFYGLRCEFEMPCAGFLIRRCDKEREEVYCLNHGLCYESQCNEKTVHACTCPEGYTGARCEFSPARREGCPYPVDEYFCQNGGLCTSMQFDGHAVFGCHCPHGYSGERCELDMSTKHDFCPIEFGEIFCTNGGVCFETSVMNEIVYYCACRDGYWGERCEFSGVLKFACPGLIDHVFCKHNGFCYMVIWAGSDIYYCECHEGFTGTRCDKQISTADTSLICLSEACQNGGTCYTKMTGGEMTYVCECPGGSWGEKCENSYSEIDSRESLTNYSNMQYILNNRCCSMLEHHTYLSKFLLSVFLFSRFLLEITNYSYTFTCC